MHLRFRACLPARWRLRRVLRPIWLRVGLALAATSLLLCPLPGAVCASAQSATPTPGPQWTLAPEDAPREMYVLVEESSWLNIRERPAADAPVTLRLTRGDAISAYAMDEDGWVEVSRAGDPGYCRVEYLTEQPPQTPVTCVATVGKLNVRALPNGKVVGRLRRGDAITVLGQMTDAQGEAWANTGDGYVLSRYLREQP